MWTSGWSRRDGRQQFRHQPSGGGADHPDAGLAGDVGVERGHVGGDVVDLVQDPAGPLDDPRALLGEATLGAVDEAYTQLLLELGDVARHVGLHGVERACRTGERPVVGDRDERRELRGHPSEKTISEYH